MSTKEPIKITNNAITPAKGYTTAAPAGPSDGDNAAYVSESTAQNLPVNFSGKTVNGKQSSFTVGGWLRLVKPPASTAFNTVFWAESQFGVSINSAGLLGVWFGNKSDPILTSEFGITDDEWHYVSVACHQPTPNVSSCEIEIVLDGVPVGLGTVDSSLSKDAGVGYVIGGGDMEYVSWSIWSVALPKDELRLPVFGPPALDSEMYHDIVAAFNFASGTAQDLSANNVPITGNPGPTYMPRLRLYSDSKFAPDPQDNVMLFGFDFSLMGWVELPRDPANYLIVAQTENMELKIIYQGGTTYWLHCFGNSLGFSAEVGSYLHIGVTSYEKEPGTPWSAFFINGHNLGQGFNGSGNRDGEPAIFGLDGPSVSCDMQGLSVWNRAVTDDERAADMNGADPTGIEGLLAYYPLEHDLRNSVTGRKATAVNAELIDVVEKEDTAAAILAALDAFSAIDDEDESQVIRFLQPSDYRKIAKSQNIALVDTGNAAALPGHHQRILAEFDEHIDLSESMVSMMRSELIENLHVAAALRREGIKTGQMELTIEDDQTVIYYHDLDGPIEIHRFDEVLDTVAEWIVTIILDVIVILGAIFGLYTTPGRLANVVRVIMFALPRIKQALMTGLNSKSSALTTIFKVIGEIYAAGIIMAVIRGLVSGSWWSLIFTAISILGQLLLIVVTEGVALTVKLVMAAVAVGKLLVDLGQYPGSDADEIEDKS